MSTAVAPPSKTSPSVFLGVFDDYMSLHQNELTSLTKLGGTPTYFPQLLSAAAPAAKGAADHQEVAHSLSASQLEELREGPRCGVCGRHMFLLVQAYAPAPSFALSTPSAAHNRMLYVWCCNSSGCASSASISPSRITPDSWKCLVVQVDKEDEEAFGEGSENEGSNDEDEDANPYCEFPLPLSALPRPSFPPCHVHITPEPPKRIGAPFPLPPPSKEEEALKKKVTDPSLEEELKALDKEVDLKNSAVDYHYDAFRVRLEREPRQILRYYSPSASALHTSRCCSNSSNSQPIFMNPMKVSPFFVSQSSCSSSPAKGKPATDTTEGESPQYPHDGAQCEDTHPSDTMTESNPADSVTGKKEEEEDPIQKEARLAEECAAAVTGAEFKRRCSHCGGPLRAELQIMPTSLYFLHPSSYLPTPLICSTATTSSGPVASAVPSFVKVEDQCIDFGTVTVWTCAGWCRAKESGVIVEEDIPVLVEPPPSGTTAEGKRSSAEGFEARQKKTDLRAFMTSKDIEEEEEK